MREGTPIQPTPRHPGLTYAVAYYHAIREGFSHADARDHAEREAERVRREREGRGVAA